MPDLTLKVQSTAIPLIPVGHPLFRWTSGADVQALWRQYGWVPPSESRPPQENVDRERGESHA